MALVRKSEMDPTSEVISSDPAASELPGELLFPRFSGSNVRCNVRMRLSAVHFKFDTRLDDTIVRFNVSGFTLSMSLAVEVKTPYRYLRSVTGSWVGTARTFSGVT